MTATATVESFASLYWVYPGEPPIDRALIDGLVAHTTAQALAQHWQILDRAPVIAWPEPNVPLLSATEYANYKAGWRLCRVELRVYRTGPG